MWKVMNQTNGHLPLPRNNSFCPLWIDLRMWHCLTFLWCLLFMLYSLAESVAQFAILAIWMVNLYHCRYIFAVNCERFYFFFFLFNFATLIANFSNEKTSPSFIDYWYSFLKCCHFIFKTHSNIFKIIYNFIYFILWPRRIGFSLLILFLWSVVHLLKCGKYKLRFWVWNIYLPHRGKDIFVYFVSVWW